MRVVLLSKSHLVPIVAVLCVWGVWSIWANYPHYYDAAALQEQINAAWNRPNAPPVLQPAVVGFPFNYMSYEFGPERSLNIVSFKWYWLVVNLLLCTIGVLATVVCLSYIKRFSTRILAGLMAFLAAYIALYRLIVMGMYYLFSFSTDSVRWYFLMHPMMYSLDYAIATLFFLPTVIWFSACLRSYVKGISSRTMSGNLHPSSHIS